MESKKINQLATELSPELSDLTIIGDPNTGISKKITLSQMASLFTGTVEEYASLSAFPLVGAADTIYIALDTNIIYRWNTSTSAYVELSPNIVTSLVFNDANGFDGTISLVGSTATLTITTALTTGSVGFIGASGALTQDNANFFWDNSNKRLGINTNAPTTALDVFGSGIIGRVNGTSTNNAFLGFASAGSNKWSIGNVQSDHRFRIYNEATTSELVSVLQTGEFGIGIANPTTKLHIDGGASALIANLDANVSVAKSISFRSDNSARINLEVSGTESGSNAGADLFIKRYSDAGAFIDTPFTITRSTGLITLLNVYATKINFEKTYNYITSGGTSNLDLIVSGDDNIQFKTANAAITNAVFKDGGDSYFNYRLGIGITNPTDKLHIYGTGTNTQSITLEASVSSANAYITHKNTARSYSTGLTVDVGTNNYIVYDNTAAALRFLINTSGNVGIGTSTPNVSGQGSSQRVLTVQGQSSTWGGFEAGSDSFQNGALIGFYGFTSTTITGSSAAGMPAYIGTWLSGTTGSDIGAEMRFFVKGNGSATTQRMVITNNGFLGLNTTTASTNLTINDSGGAKTNVIDLIANGNSTKGHIGQFNNKLYISSNWYYNGSQNADTTSFGQANIVFDTQNVSTGTNINFGTSEIGSTVPVERMRITASGALWVNQTSASAASAGGKMQVAADLLTTGSSAGFFWENRSGGVTSTSNWYGWYTTSGTIYLYNGGGNIASINTSSGAYTALSDINKKKDFEYSTIGLNAILNLKPTLYRFKDEDDSVQKHLGFIAQEVKEYIPQAYIQTKGEKEDFIGLDDRPIIAALVKSIQELKSELDELKSK